MQDAMIQKLAEKDPQYYGAQLAGTLTVANKSAAGTIKDIKFLDTDTCFWQLTQQQSMQHKANTADLIPYLGEILVVLACNVVLTGIVTTADPPAC